MKLQHRILFLLVASGIFISFLFASAEQSIIPSWIKITASFWVEDQISDEEFIAALQYLVEKGILVIPVADQNNVVKKEPELKTGFSSIVCKQEFGFITMSGDYTNGDTSYSEILLRLVVIGQNGEVLATGNGTIFDIGEYQTKSFGATAHYDGSFKSCEIEIDQTYR